MDNRLIQCCESGEQWTQSFEITTKRDLHAQGVHTGLQETPRSLLPVTLWEDTLRYVNRRSLVHNEAESGLESGRDMQKLCSRGGNDRTHFTVWRLTWPGIKANFSSSLPPRCDRPGSWRQRWKIISIIFSRACSLQPSRFATFLPVRRDVFERDFKRGDGMSLRMLRI